MKKESINKTNIIKKALFILLIATLCSLLLIPIGLPQIASAASSSKNSAVQNPFIEQMNAEYESDVELAKTKQLKDLDNNTYTLLECNPAGYIIICDDSNTMVEYSAFSVSPYIEYDKDLYYFGPTYFSVLNGNDFIDLMSGGILFSLNKDVEIEKKVKTESKVMHDTMVEQAQSAKNNISPLSEGYDVYNTHWTCVNNYGFFTTKTDNISFSYYQQGNSGCCGYVAASLLLGYYDQFVKRCVPDKFMEWDSYGYKRYKRSSEHGYYRSGEFTQHIMNFKTASGTGTTSTTLRECLTGYFKYYGYTNMGVYDMITPLFSNLTLKNLIDKSTPSILFGSLEDPTSPPSHQQGSGHGNHAVVVYGYRKGANNGSIYSFLVHYGWSGRSQSTINYIGTSTFGSMLKLRDAT